MFDRAHGPARGGKDGAAQRAAFLGRAFGVGFFGSRFERATPGEREYLRAMAEVAAKIEAGEELDAFEPVPTAEVATLLGRKPQSLSPAREGLLKKGLIYSAEHGRIAG